MRSKVFFLITFITLILIFAGCTQSNGGNNSTDTSQQNNDFTRLYPPFRDDGGKDWYMTQSFGAYYSNYNGHHPGEDWNRDSGNNDVGESVYPIAPGVVVKTGQVSEGNGYYIILKHSGKFLVPASSGPHLLSLVKPTYFDGHGHNQGNPMIESENLFVESGTMNLTDYVFEKEDKYNYPQKNVDTIYSVYMHIDKPEILVGDEIKESDINKSIGKLASLSGNNAHFHIEIRYKNADIQLILGGKGNGYFNDSQKMVDLGYREPSSIIQANIGKTASQGEVTGASTNNDGEFIEEMIEIPEDGKYSGRNTLIGIWQDPSGNGIQFFTDGSCIIGGNDFYYNILDNSHIKIQEQSTPNFGPQILEYRFNGDKLFLKGNSGGSEIPLTKIK